MRYKDAHSPEEYLRAMVIKWKAYRRANGGVCKAIEALLDKCERLENELAREKRKMKHKTCPYCGANLDFGETCDCLTEVKEKGEEENE